MKIKFRCSDELTLETEVSTIADAVKWLAQFKVLAGDRACGNCKSENIRWDHRVAQGYDFYSQRCNDCNAQLDFSPRKNESGGGMFIKRVDKDRNEIGNNGWYVYQRQEQNSYAPSYDTKADQEQGAVPF